MANRPYLNSEFRDGTFERFYYEVHNEEEYQGIRSFGVPTFPTNFIADDTDEIFIIPPQLEYRPDLISVAKYGRPDWDFAIYLLNNLDNMIDLYSGRRIRLASRDRVRSELL